MPNSADFDRQLDAALRQRFAPPVELEARLQRTFDRATVRKPRWHRVATAAAAIAAALLLGWFLRPAHNAEVARLWAATYEHAVGAGFEQASCCAGPVDLGEVCNARFACGIRMVNPELLRFCGQYCGDLRGCTGFLVRAEGEPVCLFVQPAQDDPRPDGRALAPLYLHRQEVGTLVFYEVSKQPQARVLPHLRP